MRTLGRLGGAVKRGITLADRETLRIRGDEPGELAFRFPEHT